jgi:cell division protein FtsN
MAEIILPQRDTGYATGSPEALRRLREGFELEKRLGSDAAGEPVIKHATQRAREQRELEEAAEQARRAGPDPRGVLREAQRLRAEAQQTVDHLQPALGRARELVANLDAQVAQYAAASAAGERAAADALVEALASGAETPPAVDDMSCSRISPRSTSSSCCG